MNLGSNAYGIGSRGARGERSLVLGNPHFPWHGSERWYEVHLTIPGKLNVIGAALQGVPAVNIGFNRGVAWSHTVSTARRFTPYQLELRGGRPTALLVDGRPVAMRKRTVRVRVRGGGFRRHTFYRPAGGRCSRSSQAGLTWTNEHAYALADVNADNFRLLNQWAEYDKAQSVRGLQRAYRKVQGNPWVNTIAADSRGRAYYADESVVPNVDAALQRRCTADNPIAPLLVTQGVMLLDGSRVACRWKRDRDALARGIIGPKALPRAVRARLRRELQRLVLAAERALPAPRLRAHHRRRRTRSARCARGSGSIQAEQRLAGTDGLGPAGFTLDTLQQVVFGNRNLSAELAQATRRSPRAGRAAAPISREACDVLAAWDGRADIDSRGAVLWREYWRQVDAHAVDGAVRRERPGDDAARLRRQCGRSC